MLKTALNKADSEGMSTSFTADALAPVRRLSFAVLDAGDHAAVYRALAEAFFSVLGVEQVHISRLSQDHVVGRGNGYTHGADGELVVGPDYELHFDETSAVRRVAVSGEPVNEPDAPNSKLMKQDMVKKFNVASALFVPLALDGHVRAVIGCISETQREFNEEVVELASTLANQAAAAIAMLDMRGSHGRARRAPDRAGPRGPLTERAARPQGGARDPLSRGRPCPGRPTWRASTSATPGTAGSRWPATGMDPEWFGYVIQPGEGVGGQVLVTGQAGDLQQLPP